jgi:hypothetical protein
MDIESVIRSHVESRRFAGVRTRFKWAASSALVSVSGASCALPSAEVEGFGRVGQVT